jgi:hypothetical protein
MRYVGPLCPLAMVFLAGPPRVLGAIKDCSDEAGVVTMTV